MNQVFRHLLKPAALLYKPVIELRNLAYTKGLMKTYKAAVPVISIGNITLGGTGKTPITINIAEQLVAQGKKVAVLSRGYKRKSSGMVVVSDGTKLLCNAQQAGDEPYLIAQRVKEAVVIAAARRVDAAHMAVDDFKCNVILLDDGFQHRAIDRDLNMVLIDYEHDLLKDSIFPVGNLREPLTELRRAGAIVITNVPEIPDNSRLQTLSNTIARFAPDAPQYQCRFVPSRLVRVFEEAASNLRLDELQGKSAVAFCGIAAPHRFFNQLQNLGLHVVVRQSYPDHHWYQPGDVQEIRRRLENSGSNLIVTTAKDAVRLQAMAGRESPGREDLSREDFIGLPLWYLDMRVVWLSDAPSIASAYIEAQHSI